MNQSQTKAIDNYAEELISALERTVGPFLAHLQLCPVINNSELQIVKKETSSKAELIVVFGILKYKDNGWRAIIDYLYKNDCKNLASKLQTSAGEKNQTENRHTVENFVADLVSFYSGNYRTVESFDGHPVPIDLVWVDVPLAGYSSSTSDYEDIFARMREINCRTTLIQGQPGSGKTTLVKKIAYDWAVQKSDKNTVKSRFDLVLAVPLRSIQSEADLLEMAVEYSIDKTADRTEIKTIVSALRHYRMKILLILDGLDEWEIRPSAPLAKIFGSAAYHTDFKWSTNKVEFDFELMITSRPYACDFVNENFLAVKWTIVGLSEDKQKQFVNLRCRTEIGKIRATEYLKNSAVLSEIGQIPLLLLLVCFLADQSIPVPTSLTHLYETFILRMLTRSANKGSISNFDPHSWRKSDLVANLGRLALLGVIKNKFEFTRKEMDICHVGHESFASGLLLFRSDPVSLAIKGDFPHRSIQEFLAALHSVDFWSTSDLTTVTNWPKDIWPISGIAEMTVEMLQAKMLEFGDSQFCRFYFGLLSGEPEFELKMKKSLEERLYFLISPHFLFCLSNSLADCSDAESSVTARTVTKLILQSLSFDMPLESAFTEVFLQKNEVHRWTEDMRIINWPVPVKSEFRLQLQSQLKLTWLGSSLNSFYIGSDNSVEAEMIRISLDENMAETLSELQNLQKVKWLIISQPGHLDYSSLKLAVKRITLMPKGHKCLIFDQSVDYFFIRLWLKKKSKKRGGKAKFPANSVNPEFFYFEIQRNFGEKLFHKLSSLRRTDSGDIDVVSIKRRSHSISKGVDVTLAVKNSDSVLKFLQSEADWDIESGVQPQY